MLRVESKRLNSEINSIISTHQEELNSLTLKISTKQKTISERESNLTAIGTYVDKLEERLTSFAVTRRDIQVRENNCKEIEESALKTEAEMKQLLVKISDYEGEQVELKKLLQELALERTNLQKDNRKLLTEREFRIGEEEQMQARTASLEAQVQSLEDYLRESQMKIDELAPALEASKGANADLQVYVTRIDEMESELECLKSDNAQLREECEKAMTGFRNVQEELRVALDEKKQAEDENAKLALDEKKRAEDENAKLALDEKKRAEDENARLLSRLAESTTSRDTDETDSDEELSPEEESQSQQSGGEEPLTQPVRDIPLRALRKAIAKTTGLHGILTPSSKMGQTDKKLQPGRGPKGEISRMPNVWPLPKDVPTSKGQPSFSHSGQPPAPPPPLPREQQN
jgi:chromosome segregation ATPase